MKLCRTRKVKDVLWYWRGRLLRLDDDLNGNWNCILLLFAKSSGCNKRLKKRIEKYCAMSGMNWRWSTLILNMRSVLYIQYQQVAVLLYKWSTTQTMPSCNRAAQTPNTPFFNLFLSAATENIQMLNDINSDKFLYLFWFYRLIHCSKYISIWRFTPVMF